ncbi:MAG: hypothetical protein AB7F29_13850 [Candidatus Nitrosocosmicus sp.]
MTIDLETEIQGEVVPSEDALNAGTVDEPAPLSRDIVSKIVERERNKAYEKGKQEALMQLQEQQGVSQQEPAQPVVAQQAQTLGGMPQLSQADIERLIAEKAPQLLQEQMQEQLHQQRTRQTVDSFVAKMQAAESKYPGLEAKLNDLDYSTLAPVIQMANELENTGDIINELVENPEKMSSIILLSYTQPRLAQKKLMDLSNSIKTNQQALAEEAQARDPMSQLKPSTSAGVNESAMSTTDFRKMFR